MLMEEILHQLRCGLSQYVQGLRIPGRAGFLPSIVSSPTRQFPPSCYLPSTSSLSPKTAGFDPTKPPLGAFFWGVDVWDHV